jgi:hypothetical protein
MMASKVANAIDSLGPETRPQQIEDQSSWHRESGHQRGRPVDEVGLLLASKLSIGVHGEEPSMSTRRPPLLAAK